MLRRFRVSASSHRGKTTVSPPAEAEQLALPCKSVRAEAVCSAAVCSKQRTFQVRPPRPSGALAAPFGRTRRRRVTSRRAGGAAAGCKCVQVHASSCESVQVRESPCESVQVRESPCESVQVRASACKCVQVRESSPSQCKPVATGLSRFGRHFRVSVSKCKQVQASASKCKQVPRQVRVSASASPRLCGSASPCKCVHEARRDRPVATWSPLPSQCKSVQISVSKCKQVQASAGKCVQAHASACKPTAVAGCPGQSPKSDVLG
jgi:hypothetical protein